jgi:hypothetical protein
VSENSVDDAVEGLTEKEEKQFLDYLARKQSQSGLWKMASATVYEYKACKSHNFDDLAMEWGGVISNSNRFSELVAQTIFLINLL